MRGKKCLTASLVIVFVLLTCLGNLHAQTIKVTSPAADASWYKETAYTITWTRSATADKKLGTLDAQVGISLFDHTGSRRVLSIIGATPNNGRFTWTVPPTIPDGSYRIRVQTANQKMYGDSAVFQVQAALRSIPLTEMKLSPRIEIIQPQGRTRSSSGRFLALNKTRCSIRVSGGERGPFQIWLRWRDGERGCRDLLGEIAQIPTYPPNGSAIAGTEIVLQGCRIAPFRTGPINGTFQIEVKSLSTGTTVEGNPFQLEGPSISVTTELDGTRFDVPPEKQFRVDWKLNIDRSIYQRIRSVRIVLDKEGVKDTLAECPGGSTSRLVTLSDFGPAEGAFGPQSNIGRGQRYTYPPGEYRIEVWAEGHGIELYGWSGGTFHINQ